MDELIKNIESQIKDIPKYIDPDCTSWSMEEGILLSLNEAKKVIQLRKALAEIRQVACGEKQVADDDTEALHWIYKRIEALNGNKVSK